jgi:hypothetical protein
MSESISYGPILVPLEIIDEEFSGLKKQWLLHPQNSRLAGKNQYCRFAASMVVAPAAGPDQTIKYKSLTIPLPQTC